MISRQQIADIIMDRCDEILEYEYGLGICNSGTVAYKSADDILALLKALLQPPGALAGEAAKAAETEGLGSRASDGEAGTPSPPPSPRKGQEENPCPMTVEEARAIVAGMAYPENFVKFYRNMADLDRSENQKVVWERNADRIELALSTIRASEEDR